MSILKTLRGDTTKLKALLQPILDDLYDGKWEIEVTV